MLEGQRREGESVSRRECVTLVAEGSELSVYLSTHAQQSYDIGQPSSCLDQRLWNVGFGNE